MNTDLFDVAVSVVAETEKSFLHDPRRDTCVLHIFNLVLLFITALHCNIVHGNILIYMCRSADNRLGSAWLLRFSSLPFPSHLHTISRAIVQMFSGRRHMVISCIRYVCHNMRPKTTQHKLFIILRFGHTFTTFPGKTGFLIIDRLHNCTGTED